MEVTNSFCSNLRVISIWIFNDMQINELFYKGNREKSLKEHTPKQFNLWRPSQQRKMNMRRSVRVIAKKEIIGKCNVTKAKQSLKKSVIYGL